MKRYWKAAAWIVIAGLLAALAAAGLIGCATSENSYKEQWKKTMQSFFDKLDADDKKAHQLSSSGNTGGVIKLVNERVASIQKTIKELMAIDPPEKLAPLHIETLYFLLALIDQLEAQNELNKAMVAGQPTTDLTTRVENSQKRVAAVGQELSVEQVSQGIVFDKPKNEQSSPSTTPKPATTAPSTQPPGNSQ